MIRKNLFYFIKIFLMTSVLTFLVCGCWDKVELENRGFVNTIGVDKYKKDDNVITFEGGEKKRLSISVLLPFLDSSAGNSGSEKKSVKTAANETITSAMKIINSSSNQRLYFGQTKGIVLGKELLSDEKLFRETVDTLERNRELNRKIFILSTEEEAKKILSEEITGEPLVGMFVSNFYKNNSGKVAFTFRQDLINLIKELRINGSAVIPKISLIEKNIKLGGAAVIKNYSLVGWLNDRETRGFLLFNGKASVTQLSVNDDDAYIALSIDSQKSKITFYEEDDEIIICNVQLKLVGTIEEYNFGDTQLTDNNKVYEITTKYEDVISKEVVDSFECFQNKFQVDAIGLKDKLRKKNYDIYLKNEDDWERAFKNMKLKVETDLQITNTGSVR